MAKVGFGTFFGFLGSRRMVSGTKRARFFINLSPVGNLTGSIFLWRINLEQPYGKSWVWHVFMAHKSAAYRRPPGAQRAPEKPPKTPSPWPLGPREAGFSSFYPL